MTKLLAILCLCCIININTLAQREIRGKVLTSENKAIPNVSVKLKNFDIGTITDDEGNYRIWLPEKVKTIKFSDFNKHIVKEIKFISETEINIIAHIG